MEFHLPASHGLDLELGKFNEVINPRNFNLRGDFIVEPYHHCIIAQHKHDFNDFVSLRVRVGRVGYASFLNELKVYLLPGFKHKNIMPFLGFDKRFLTDDEEIFTSVNAILDEPRDEYISHSESDDDDDQEHDTPHEGEESGSSFSDGQPKRKPKLPTIKTPIEYWIVNDFECCIVLRHYLSIHTLQWPQMLRIARGITEGVAYLHEHENYTERYPLKALEEGFADSTNGNFETVYFERRSKGTMRIAPPSYLTIIHRNLSSMNIVLRSDQVPCIWNFGTARVNYPIQPLAYKEIIDKRVQEIHETSVYTAPEVLAKNSSYTVTAMQAIDMYAVGLVLWELLSRCKLPPVPGAAPFMNNERTVPRVYNTPLHRELLTDKPTYNLLYKNVFELHVRPYAQPCWMVGHKTARLMRTICDLWDPYWEARISARTLIERLKVTSMNRNSDRLVINRWYPSYPEATTAADMGEPVRPPPTYGIYGGPRVEQQQPQQVHSDPSSGTSSSGGSSVAPPRRDPSGRMLPNDRPSTSGVVVGRQPARRRPPSPRVIIDSSSSASSSA